MKFNEVNRVEHQKMGQEEVGWPTVLKHHPSQHRPLFSHTCNSVYSCDDQQPSYGQVQIQFQRLLNKDGTRIHVHLQKHEVDRWMHTCMH